MSEQLVFHGFGLTFAEKLEHSLEAIRQFEPKNEPYYGCFSGGKDSSVIKHLVAQTSVNIDWHYNVTTIDAPELVHFIRDQHKDVKWDRPEKSLWSMVKSQGLPTRRMRWCCKHYKERGGTGKVKLTGIRAAESPRRAKMWKICTHFIRAGHVVNWCINPILYWSDEDIWKYIRDNHIPYCKLYDEGFKRLGCIGCPMNSKRALELKRWPLYERNWRRANREWWAAREKRGHRMIDAFDNPDDMFDWWLSNDPMPADDDCQMGLF